ncbi:hypothetical protein RJK70_01545 [Buchnera aphidicola (Pseudoregma panicola)]|uniref:hypothetical protein n=1 Tax=Buchnera aphidicola TaxID=9 RepID=UPI0031B7392C
MKNYVKIEKYINYFFWTFVSFTIFLISVFLIKFNILNKNLKYFLILLFSIVNLFIYFNIFLHIKYKDYKSYYNIITIIFTLIIIFIIIFGSRYIMLSLHSNTMVNKI